MAETKNIYSKIMKVRQEFCKAEISKSGHNKFKGFKYLELHDFIPHAIELCNKYQIYTHTNIGVDGYATLTVLNIENPKEAVFYKLKLPELPTTEYNKTLKQEVPLNSTTMIQDTGKLETYVRRYLYMLFLDIAVPDTVDAGKPTTPKHKKTLKQLNKEKQAKRQEKQARMNEKTPYETQTVTPRHKPRPLQKDLQTPDPEPLRTIVNKVIRILRNEGRKPIRKNIWIKAMECCKDGRIKPELKDDLQKYIMSHCPEELE